MSPRPSGPEQPRVSIVVPTYNSARTLDACLESIVTQVDVDVELIVVDNHSTDETPEIARRWATIMATRGPERCAQRNHGASLASSDVIAFIDSDMVLEPGVAREAVDRLVAHPDVGALVIPERAFGAGPWIAARRLEKDAYLGDPTVEAARVFRRAAFVEVGGYDEHLIAGEDWDLADRVAAAGNSTGRVSSFVWHDEGTISLSESFSKKRYYGQSLATYRDRQRDNRSIGAGRVLPLLRRFPHAPVSTGRLAVLKAVEAAGFAAGAIHARAAGVR